jgi:son of sevenless-like protein
MGDLEFTKKALTSGMTTKLSNLRNIINVSELLSHHLGEIFVSPWLDLHLQSILDNHPATVRVGDTDLINFERYNKFMDRIKEVAHYMPPKLQEYRDTGRLEYLSDSHSEFPFSDNTEDALLARSLDLEAQEKIDVDLRKNVFEKLGFGVPNP